MSEKLNNIISSIIAFDILAQIALLALKIPGVISWPWKWVLAPFWISTLVVTGFCAIGVIIAICPKD